MIIPALQCRGAVKNFDPQARLDPTLVEKILEAGRLAPSAFGLQPHRMVVIADPDKRASIAPHCFNQPQITESSVLIVGQAWQQIGPADIEAYMQDIVKQRETTREALQGFYDSLAGQFLEKPQQELLSWSHHQAYISLGMMLTAAALERVDSSPMEGFDAQALDEALQTPEQYRSVFLLALGYRADHDERSRWPRVRRSMEQWALRL